MLVLLFFLKIMTQSLPSFNQVKSQGGQRYFPIKTKIKLHVYGMSMDSKKIHVFAVSWENQQNGFHVQIWLLLLL